MWALRHHFFTRLSNVTRSGHDIKCMWGPYRLFLTISFPSLNKWKWHFPGFPPFPRILVQTIMHMNKFNCGRRNFSSGGTKKKISNKFKIVVALIFQNVAPNRKIKTKKITLTAGIRVVARNPRHHISSPLHKVSLEEIERWQRCSRKMGTTASFMWNSKRGSVFPTIIRSPRPFLFYTLLHVV